MTTYTGGCHCGNVAFEVETELGPVMECNCSHCSKKGGLMTFVPDANFTLLRGEDAQTEYRFNKKAIQHLFCSTCGVQSFARGKGRDGAAMVAINVRCLDGVEPSSLTIQQVDGRSL